MGVMYSFISPEKRQYLEPISKYSTLTETACWSGVGLLLCDERRVDEGPLAIAGSWAGSELYIIGDSDAGSLAELGLTGLLAEAKGPDPVEGGLLDYLLYFARRRFDEISTASIDALSALLPGVDLSELAERVSKTRADVTGAYGDGELFVVVCPEKRQYVDPRRLGECGTIDRVFLGWPGRVIGDLLLQRDWRGPVYVAGERSSTIHQGVQDQPKSQSHQNLYEIAHAEYEEVTLKILKEFHHTQDLLEDAASSDQLLVALGDAAHGSGGNYWQDALTRALGKEWPKHWAYARKRLGK